MAYEVYQRTSFRVEDPALSLTPDGKIALNAPAVRLLREANVKFVLLLWDKNNRKVALKAAVKGDTNAYAVFRRGKRLGHHTGETLSASRRVEGAQADDAPGDVAREGQNV